MSITTSVVLLRDGKTQRHLNFIAVKESCDKLGVGYPPEVNDYFNGGDNDDPLEIEFESRYWTDNNCQSGYEIDIDELPEGVKTIRFCIS